MYSMVANDPRLTRIFGGFSEFFLNKEKLLTMHNNSMIMKLNQYKFPKVIAFPRKARHARRDYKITEVMKLKVGGIVAPFGYRPTEFCSLRVFPTKTDGTLKFATGFTCLNKQALGILHPTLSSWDVIY